MCNDAIFQTLLTNIFHLPYLPLTDLLRGYEVLLADDNDDNIIQCACQSSTVSPVYSCYQTEHPHYWVGMAAGDVIAWVGKVAGDVRAWVGRAAGDVRAGVGRAANLVAICIMY